jgi:hypothetical protein
LEERLSSDQPKREVGALLRPFRDLAADGEFWSHTRDGLAVLGAPEFFRVYLLQRPVAVRAVVADSFHTKPLLRILQSADRYQVLGVTRDRVRLFEGNRDHLDEIELAPGVPRTLIEALGSEHTEPYHGVYTYGGGARGPAMHHGTGAKKDDMLLDAERFFRSVDRAVHERHSSVTGLPLLLAALPEQHARFRAVSRNPYLMPVGLEVDPGSVSLEGLTVRAWETVRPSYLAKLGAIVEEFGRAKATGKGTADLAEAAMAAVQGRVRTLLVDADREIPGRLDASTGRIRLDTPIADGTDDLLDDLAEVVLRNGGKVVVVPSERMPAETGLAATFSY